jgi:NADPH:quinone reductase-like Zn-dependent oxidoreductase
LAYALCVYRYGSPDVLEVREIEKPAILNDNAVLVRVSACAANPADWHIHRGDPYAARLYFGLFRPRRLTVLGNDLAGTVEAVGKAVTRLKVGDEVMGLLVTGAFTEYACVPEEALSLKPANLSLEAAATIPNAALTALQGLRDAGGLQAGQSVLINGAAGGIGTFAVQLAKALGAAHVTGVCSTRNVELVRSLGADHVIDYTAADGDCSTLSSSNGRSYDLILDMIGNHSFSEFRRVLTETGTFVPVGGPGGGFLGSFGASLVALVYSQFLSHKVAVFVSTAKKDDLALMKELVEAGKVKPVLDDKKFTLVDTADAIRYIEQGHARGKVVITV